MSLNGYLQALQILLLLTELNNFQQVDTVPLIMFNVWYRLSKVDHYWKKKKKIRNEIRW